MMENKCLHVDSNGNGTIVFLNSNKWCGIYPPYVKGICTICKEQIKMTKEEYDEYMNGGDIIETNI